MVYKIRLRAREKQAECIAILFLSFFILLLTMICINLLPLVYVSFKNLIEAKPIIDVIISAFVLILCIVVFGALSMGTDRFMLKRAENVTSGAGDIFYYFAPKKLFSMCVFHLSVTIRKLIILTFLSIPTVICAVAFYILSDKGFSAAVCSIFAVFTLVFLLSQFTTYRRISDTFFLARYMFIKGEYLNKKQLLSVSQNDMVPHIKRLRHLRLSFFGWFVLCLLIFPLPYVWSYYRQSKSCFAAEIIKL